MLVVTDAILARARHTPTGATSPSGVLLRNAGARYSLVVPRTHTGMLALESIPRRPNMTCTRLAALAGEVCVIRTTLTMETGVDVSEGADSREFEELLTALVSAKSGSLHE